MSHAVMNHAVLRGVVRVRMRAVIVSGAAIAAGDMLTSAMQPTVKHVGSQTHRGLHHDKEEDRDDSKLVHE